MERPPRILTIAGSLRVESLNRKLVLAAATGARKLGCELTHLGPEDLALPLYDADLEARSGLPDGAHALQQKMRAADAFLIASPEYNSSVSGVLKNAIDWASRPDADHPQLSCFAGKVAALLSASPGSLGGLRGLVHLRAILGNLKVLVIPEQKAVPRASDVFDAKDGRIDDPKLEAQVEAIGERLAEVTARLVA